MTFVYIDLHGPSVIVDRLLVLVSVTMFQCLSVLRVCACVCVCVCVCEAGGGGGGEWGRLGGRGVVLMIELCCTGR